MRHPDGPRGKRGHHRGGGRGFEGPGPGEGRGGGEGGFGDRGGGREFGRREERGEFGRRAQRMFAPGDFRLLLLALLAEQPRHGYELIRTIEDLFGGAYAPSPGVVYPTLTLLAEQDLVAPQDEGADGKKRYAITAAGSEYVSANQAVIDGLKARVRLQAGALRGHEVPAEVRESARTLKAALMLNSRPWDEARVQRVKSAIEAAIAAVEQA
ncbi:MAG: PadR family transcriptional regulator [Steroidobacteraceae bacterium]